MLIDTLDIAYKILYSLEHDSKSEFMGLIISPDALDADPVKWEETIESLVEEGYITGISFRENILGEKLIDIKHARITLAGAQYLKENSKMAKIGKIATNVINIVK